MFQLCYASEANFSPEQFSILTDILAEARDFNARYDIRGVLFFADGYFFQYLEGEPEHIQILWDRLNQDARHHKIQLLQLDSLQQGKFASWAMKFVGRNTQVKQLFKTWGYEKFNPLNMTAQQLAELVNVLHVIEQQQSHA